MEKQIPTVPAWPAVVVLTAADSPFGHTPLLGLEFPAPAAIRVLNLSFTYLDRMADALGTTVENLQEKMMKAESYY